MSVLRWVGTESGKATALGLLEAHVGEDGYTFIGWRCEDTGYKRQHASQQEGLVACEVDLLSAYDVYLDMETALVGREQVYRSVALEVLQEQRQRLGFVSRTLHDEGDEAVVAALVYDGP